MELERWKAYHDSKKNVTLFYEFDKEVLCLPGQLSQDAALAAEHAFIAGYRAGHNAGRKQGVRVTNEEISGPIVAHLDGIEASETLFCDGEDRY